MEDNKKERRYFDQQFKLDAVRMITEGGKKISEVSRDLGVGLTQLQRWRQKYAGNGGTPKSAGTSAAPPAESAETEKLRKELALVKEEREILKKALAVFSRRP